MEKYFIPLKQSLDLKKIGFNEPCIAHFTKDHPESKPYLIISEDYSKSQDASKMSGYGVCLAPLYQQVFIWFREKYELRAQYGAFPHHTIMTNYLIEGGREDEAEFECIKKLIKIVKKKIRLWKTYIYYQQTKKRDYLLLIQN